VECGGARKMNQTPREAWQCYRSGPDVILFGALNLMGLTGWWRGANLRVSLYKLRCEVQPVLP